MERSVGRYAGGGHWTRSSCLDPWGGYWGRGEALAQGIRVPWDATVLESVSSADLYPRLSPQHGGCSPLSLQPSLVRYPLLSTLSILTRGRYMLSVPQGDRDEGGRGSRGFPSVERGRRGAVADGYHHVRRRVGDSSWPGGALSRTER